MAVEPLFEGGSPITFPVTGNVRQGRLVEYVLTGGVDTVQEAGLTSVIVLGVARDNAMQTSTPNAGITYFTGAAYPGTDASTLPNIVAVAGEGVWNLLAGSTGITGGMRVKAGAAGTVVPWVSGTDDVRAIVGTALSAIANGTTGPVRLLVA